MTQQVSTGERIATGFLRDSHLATAEELPSVVARHARAIDATDAVMYLADLQQRQLIPFPGSDVPARRPLPINATVAGWAYRTLTLLDVDVDGRRRVWIPLLDAVDRIGVLELTVDQLDDPTTRRCHLLADLAAKAVASKRTHSDTFSRLTRTRRMTLSAELQNSLLPPSTTGDERATISGLVEPAYEVGGDVFDVALDGNTAYVAVLDSVGHDLQSGLISSVAIGGFRNTRRAGADLPSIVAAVDAAVEMAFDASRFATGVFAHVDMSTGLLSWVNFGHPRPLLVRDGKVVKALDEPAGLPMGLGFGLPDVGEESLEPGDQVLFYTDGVVDARTPDGDRFGEHRLADFIVRQSAAGMLLPETVRRLVHAILERQEGELQDDATVLVFEWSGEILP